jgi:hypothetical protein
MSKNLTGAEIRKKSDAEMQYKLFSLLCDSIQYAKTKNDEKLSLPT